MTRTSGGGLGSKRGVASIECDVSLERILSLGGCDKRHIFDVNREVGSKR